MYAGVVVLLLPVLYTLLHNTGHVQVRAREHTDIVPALRQREGGLLSEVVKSVRTVDLTGEQRIVRARISRTVAKNTPSSNTASSVHNLTTKITNSRQTTVGLPEHIRERFPHFMIVGFGKAGTRALYDALRMHPQLAGPNNEERFFSRKYTRGLSRYLSSFPPRPLGGFLIEKSPDYILETRVPPRIIDAAEQAGRRIDDLIFIVVTRNPIERAMSEYLEWVVQRRKLRSPPLPAFDDMVLKDGVLQTQQPFINASCYAYHISGWLRIFSEHQMCYVDGEAFVANPLEEMHKLENCMGLDNFFTDKNFVYNKKRGFYCFQAGDSDTHCMDGSKGRKHPDISNEVRTQLTQYFHQCNARLSHLIGFEISY